MLPENVSPKRVYELAWNLIGALDESNDAHGYDDEQSARWSVNDCVSKLRAALNRIAE